MPELELFLHDQHVGIVRPVSRDRSRVMLDIDRGYRQQTHAPVRNGAAAAGMCTHAVTVGCALASRRGGCSTHPTAYCWDSHSALIGTASFFGPNESVRCPV